VEVLGKGDKMIDTSKLPIGLVNSIAFNLGWSNDQPKEPYLEQIARMTPEQALRCFSAWHLGDGGWADTFIAAIDALRKASQ